MSMEDPRTAHAHIDTYFKTVIQIAQYYDLRLYPRMCRNTAVRTSSRIDNILLIC